MGSRGLPHAPPFRPLAAQVQACTTDVNPHRPAMDTARFHALVDALELEARKNPEAVRRRAKALLALGYGYILMLLLVGIGATVALVWGIIVTGRGAWAIKLLPLPLVLIWVILKSLRLPTYEPEGQVLDRSQAPRLWARVDEIRDRLRAPRADVMLLVRDFNAAVTQQPRFSIFGGYRTYLIVGLPMMYGLSPKHFDAVLAHEFGHLSGAHPKFGLMLGRVGRTWNQLLSQFQASTPVTKFLFERFFRWFVPRLDAYAFALGRGDEYAADRDSVELVGAKVAAQALASGQVRGRHYDDFWKGIFDRVEHEAEPTAQSWTGLPAWMRGADDRPERTEWLGRALEREGLVDDTHPALRARIAALNAFTRLDDPPESLYPELVPPLETSAAEHYLGRAAEEHLAAWEREWFAMVAPDWKARHEAVRERRARIDALVAREAAGEALTPKELWEVASGIVDLDGDEPATPWLERVVRADPKHAAAHFYLGRALLARRDGGGVRLLETAMDLDVQAVPAVTEMLRHYHASVGDRTGAVEVAVRAQPRFDRMHQVNEERTFIGPKDRCAPPELTPEQVRLLERTAAAVPGVQRIWAAQKVLTHSADESLLIILVEPRRKFLTSWGTKRQEMAQQVFDRIAEPIGREILLLAWQDDAGWLRKIMRKGGGVRIDAARGLIPVRPPRWYERHARALVIGGVGAALLALVAWATHVPQRFEDPRGMIAEDERRNWDLRLEATRTETKVDVRMLLDSLEPGADPAAVARAAAARLEVGRGTEGLGVVVLGDAGSGRVHVEPIGTMGSIMPASFVTWVHATQRVRDGEMLEGMRDALLVVHQRLREASFETPRPWRRRPAPDVMYVWATTGDTLVYPILGPLQPGVVRDTVLEALLRPGATPDEAYVTFQDWLRLDAYVPRATFLTAASRAFYEKEFRMTPMHWEHMRQFYLDRPMKFVEREGFAIAYSTEDPLAYPLFFRQGKDGWQMDAVAELVNTQNIITGGLTWTLTRTGGDYEARFGDLYADLGGVWRLADGANEELRPCGCRR